LGRLDGSIQTLPDPDLFVYMYMRKEAVLSSQIEGTQSSLNDILQAEASVIESSKNDDLRQVINYIAAMEHGLQRLKESFPISVRLFREIHERLLREVRGAQQQPGEIRRSQNWIGPRGGGINDAIFIPPPPHEVSHALSELEIFLHNDTPMPFLIKVGLAHAQFETIHPFLDGNGRLGRLLITFLLCYEKILIKPVLYLSLYLRKHRTQYYDLLQAIRTDGNWEAWLKFFVTAVAEVSLTATETARNIVELRERDRNRIIADFGNAAGNGLRVLEKLFSSPILNVKQVAGVTGTSYQAANVLVSRLEEHHILHEITGRSRNRYFTYREYTNLFSDLT
jgi:Fic family protein